jgi:hypothetical protein
MAVFVVILFCTFIHILQNSFTQAQVNSEQFWEGYPMCSAALCFVPLLEAANCETPVNHCVCTNATFLFSAAECCGQFCPNDVIYNKYSNNCSSNSYVFALSDEQWGQAWQEGHNKSPFWTTYPSCTLDNCLAPLLGTSGCEYANDICVCTNSTLITSVSQCAGSICPNDVIYNMFSSNCSSEDYAFALTQDQWNAAWQAGREESPTGTFSMSINAQSTVSESAFTNTFELFANNSDQGASTSGQMIVSFLAFSSSPAQFANAPN